MNGIVNVIAIIAAFVVGGIIGTGFGFIQEAARRRNEKKQAEGRLNNMMGVMAGSGARVAYLLITLLLVQLICPMLFREGIKWWVSGGLVLGYGIMLYRDLRKRVSDSRR
jgi:p-aminobenzoyl-glutamate transporter AbgT